MVAHRHHQPVGDLLVAEPRRDQIRYLAFTHRQGQRVRGDVRCGRANTAAFGSEAVSDRGGLRRTPPVPTWATR